MTQAQIRKPRRVLQHSVRMSTREHTLFCQAVEHLDVPLSEFFRQSAMEKVTMMGLIPNLEDVRDVCDAA